MTAKEVVASTTKRVKRLVHKVEGAIGLGRPGEERTADKVKEVISKTAEKAKDAVDGASRLASDGADKAKAAVKQVGQTVKETGQKIKDKGE